MEVMCEMLASDLKADFLTLKAHSDDEDYESEEKVYEEIDKKRNAIDEKCNIDDMKNSYVRGFVWGKDVTDVITETIKIKGLEVRKELRDKRKEDSESDDNISFSESHSSDDKSECERGDSLDDFFDG